MKLSGGFFFEGSSYGSLVGGFNPIEKYWSKWESSPNRGENKQYLKPPPSSPFWSGKHRILRF